MTSITQTQGSAWGDTLPGRARALRDRVQDAYARRRVYRRTITELSALSDRELNDINLSRSSISYIAYETAYGK